MPTATRCLVFGLLLLITPMLLAAARPPGPCSADIPRVDPPTGTSGSPAPTTRCADEDNDTPDGLRTCPEATAPATGEHWIPAWSTSPSDAVITRPVAGQTIRQFVAPLHDGDIVRVRLQNTFGASDVPIADVALSRQADGPALLEGSACMVTFGGESATVVPAGGSALSDPVTFPVRVLEKLGIDLYVEGGSSSRHATSAPTRSPEVSASLRLTPTVLALSWMTVVF